MSNLRDSDTSPPHVLFLFVDGVGLGAQGRANPLTSTRHEALLALSGGQTWTNPFDAVTKADRVARPIDATLGVEGLPQSGTGQAALFSGIDAPRIAGRHYGPFPHTKTRTRLEEENLFRRVGAMDHLPRPAAAFANAYPEIFFERRSQRDRWTVTTYCCRAAGVPLRGWEEWQSGRAVTADLTGAAWRERLGYELDPISEEEAGHRLVRMSRDHPLTVFEYFLTDKAGHEQDPEWAAEILTALDRLLTGILDTIDPDRQLLVLSSDHGNLEDLNRGVHTRNPVPLLAHGPRADRFAGVRSIREVPQAILEVLRSGSDPGA